MQKSKSFGFSSELFDYKSELCLANNAGNCFYGEDVARFIQETLRESVQTVEIEGEDWGWLVTGTLPGGHGFEIGVYNLAEDNGASYVGTPNWGIWIEAFSIEKFLWIFSRTRSVPVPEELETMLKTAFEARGARIREWECDAPH